MDSAVTSVRSPAALAGVNPPLSVAFTTTVDGFANIALRDSRDARELAHWQERIDPGIPWFANANFQREDKPFQGYLVLTVEDDTRQLQSVTVLPVTIGVPGT
jgi:hypothetical protein